MASSNAECRAFSVSLAKHRVANFGAGICGSLRCGTELITLAISLVFLRLAVSKGKGKGHPRTYHEGPEGEKRYSYTLSLTSALDGVGGQRHPPGRFTPKKDPVPIV